MCVSPICFHDSVRGQDIIKAHNGRIVSAMKKNASSKNGRKREKEQGRILREKKIHLIPALVFEIKKVL